MKNTGPYTYTPRSRDEPYDPGRIVFPVRPKPIPGWSTKNVRILAWAVRLAAIVNMVISLLRHEPKLIYWLGKWVPFEISEGHRLRMLLMSALLLILASGLERGKRSAWLLTIAVLTIAPILHLGRAVVWPQALMSLSLILFLVINRRHFVARSDQNSIRTALVVCPILAAALIVFGTVRLHALHKYTEGKHTWMECFQTATELVIVHQTHIELPKTPHAVQLFVVLRMGGTSIALLGLILMLRPVLLRQKASEEQRARVRRLIHWYGRDPVDSYALLEDKSYFFTEGRNSVVPYVLSGKLAVALADPIGAAHDRPQAIAEFSHFCRCQDWEPVFYAISPELISYYKQADFSVFKIGEEARLRADTFDLKGADFQNLRTACNRAHKSGLRFHWYHAAQGIDTALEQQLAEISQTWLREKGAREMTFDMGSFCLKDIRQNGAAIAIDPAGRALAFATWRPFARVNGQALDLMRSLPEARNVMDFVLVKSIDYFRKQGIADISLGNSPLANAEKETTTLLTEEKVVQFLFENLNRIYGYKSLFEFKRKYRPTWSGRYVAYRRVANLPRVGLALVRIHAPEGIWKFLVG